MKKCVKCNTQYDDGKLFCPVCGEQLVSDPSGAQPRSTGPGSFFSRWLGILLGILGLIIEWGSSLLIGFVVALVGAAFGYASSNKINKMGSIVLAIVAAVLFIVVI